MFGVVDAIKRAKIQLKGDLIIMSSVDEMCFKDGARLLEENGIKADYCIMGESTNFDIGIVHTGKAEVEIRVTSKVVSLYEIAVKAENMGQKLTNPIIAMHNIIDYLLKMKKEDPFFQKTHPLLPGKGAAINIGTIIGGSTGDGDPTRRPGREPGQFGLAKRMPTYCYLRVGVRHWPGQTAKEFLDTINKWVDKAAKENPSIETEVELYLDNGNDPFEISEDAELVQIMKEVIRHSIQKEPKLVGTIFSTEGPYYQRAGMQFVYCSVPEHSIIGEYVTKEELMKLAKIWTAAAVYCVS
jgi:acetylornithine deacetylase/succinyl-diaminopimelate desuccinylase-like protein